METTKTIAKFDHIRFFDPQCCYHFNRGITLNMNGNNAYLRGGPKFYRYYEFPQVDGDEIFQRPEYIDLPKQIGSMLGVHAIAYTDKYSAWKREEKEHPGIKIDEAKAFKPQYTFPPTETIFPIGEGYVTTEDLSNTLIGNSIGIENLIHILAFQHENNSTKYPLDFEALNASAYIRDQIVSGNLGPSDLDAFVNHQMSAGIPIKQAFFVHNIYKIMDDIQSAFLRACYHFTNMSRLLWEINQSIDITDDMWKTISHWTQDDGGEICHISEESDLVTVEFTGAVIACYSSLDFLFQMFKFLVRDPLINPAIPRDLHFPSNPPAQTSQDLRSDDLNAQFAPFAIPYLPQNKVSAIRKLRNDLAHNMSLGDQRTRIFIGAKLPPVNGQDFQYAFYLTRDMDSDFNPIVHDWFKSFYQQGLDGQLILHQWLFDSWNCIYDTFSWLKFRLNNKVKDANLQYVAGEEPV